MNLEQAKSRWRGEGSRPWSASDDGLLMEGQALSFTPVELAVLLGRTPGAVRMRIATLQRRAQTAAEESRMAARGRTRPCMRCAVPFASEGPHNRMCDPCRSYANGLSPMAPDDGCLDDDGAEAAEDDASAAPSPGLPLIAHPWRTPPRAAAAAALAHLARSATPGGVKVQGKRGATAAWGRNVQRDHPALQKLPVVNRGLNHE